ncbi:MAG TPA: hypothetical protein VG733_07135 [Chthoniobacteraceae bacterium]|nr:hypothetical protein [Chthoniobacteraceae bacterium]
MNIRRFLHVLAIAFSSLFAMLTHGHADPPSAKKVKKSQGQLSKPANQQNNIAGDDPPRHLDPAMLAAIAEAPKPTLFGASTTAMPYGNLPPQNPQFNNDTTPAAPKSFEKTRYPWKEKIVTTTFWVGELPTKNNPVPNTVSSWDPNWAINYGGFDNPDSTGRKDFIPVDFTPRQNPFYIALPYNDMEKTGFKAEASKVVPWFKDAYTGPMNSVCKDRWVAIRFQNKTVYAQWEDCGPFRTDHWEYVFGDERPKPNLNHGAGLDVSPAVRDYLGMNSTDVTDWRFVDFDEVPPGPWSKYGENNTFVINQRKQMERTAELRDDKPRQNGLQ